MKLSLEIHTTKTTIETDYTPDIAETVEHLYRLCICAGFSPKGTAEAFLDYAEEIIKVENPE